MSEERKVHASFWLGPRRRERCLRAAASRRCNLLFVGGLPESSCCRKIDIHQPYLDNYPIAGDPREWKDLRDEGSRQCVRKQDWDASLQAQPISATNNESQREVLHETDAGADSIHVVLTG